MVPTARCSKSFISRLEARLIAKGTRVTEKTTGRHSRPASAVTEEIVRLQDLVQQHRVCWEVLPEQLPRSGEKPLQVGFQLLLYGAHAHKTDRPLPGCDQCLMIYGHLRDIAMWIVPKVERPSRYEIEIFDSSVRYDPVRSNRPDVTVTIKILHRSQCDAPVDQCETFCLHEMEEKLLEIGAQHQQWRDS